MSRSAAFFVLLLAIVSGVLASATVIRYVRRQAEPPKEEKLLASVVVAKARIPAGTAIRADQIETAQRDPESLPQGAVLSRDAVLGRVAKTSIYPGEVVLGTRLAQPGSADGLPALIPRGYRAITLRVDATTSVAGFIYPGDYVDVLTTIEMPEPERETITKVILQNVKVLATGHEIERNTDENEDENRTKAKVVPTVTVLVTLEQAERLTLATNAGNIQLVLRNHIDRIPQETPGATLSNLIPRTDLDVKEQQVQVAALEPQALPEPTPQVVTIPVYRGGRMTETAFVLNRDRRRFEPYQAAPVKTAADEE